MRGGRRERVSRCAKEAGASEEPQGLVDGDGAAGLVVFM